MSAFRPSWPIWYALLALPVLADGTQTSGITGEVRDAAGAPVPEVRVILSGPNIQGLREYRTDARGRFYGRLLPPGPCHVRLIKEGCQVLDADLRLLLGEEVSPRFTLLPVGSGRVDVVGTLAQLDAASTTTAMDFRLEQVEALPMARMPENMLTLVPGIVEGSTPGQSTLSGGAQFRGSSSTNNLFLVDGQNVNDGTTGTRGISLIDDAIQEVQVITGCLPAMYGNLDGGVVNAITRSGGNTFTGTLRFEGQNDAWNALQPRQSRALVVSKLTYDTRLTLGGYVLKDRLWFFLAGFQASTSRSQALRTGIGAGLPYQDGSREQNFQGKLTWQPAEGHTLAMACTSGWLKAENRNYGAGELDALVPQLNQNRSWSLSWNATFGSRLALEARIGTKREGLRAGGTHPGLTPILDWSQGAWYRNGPFNWNDGGDHRDNDSADLRATFLLDGAGTHEVTFGTNLVREWRRAQNQQSVTNDVIYVFGYDPGDPAAVTDNPWFWTRYFSTPGKAIKDTTALFANDTWRLGERWALNLGLRWDQFRAHSEDASARPEAQAWSPRLGVKFDVAGDARWQVAASFCRYASDPFAGILSADSLVGSPGFADYAYGGPTGPGGFVSQADLTDFAHWSGNLLDYGSNLTLRIADGLRAPRTDEWQVSIAHAFRLGGQEGFVKLTAVRKTFRDLFDFNIGNGGTLVPPEPYAAAGPLFVTSVANSAVARRDYRSLELDSGLQAGRFNVSANATWARLEGNYQDENHAGLEAWSVVNGRPEFDWRAFNPYGPLPGSVPLRIRAAASATWDSALGRTTLGLIHRFDGGNHLSRTRSVDPAMINPDLAQYAQAATSAWGQYQGNQRGTRILPSQALTDLSVLQEFGTSRIRAFLKCTARNVFNHQQLVYPPEAWADAATGLADPWVQVPRPLTRSAYGPARSILAEAGVKF